MMTTEEFNDITAGEKPSKSIPSYPLVVHPNVTQYDENVFVWFDETGAVGGARNDLAGALHDMAWYAMSMNFPKKSETSENEWLIHTNTDSILLYTLKEYRDHRGRTSDVNDMMIRIENANGSSHDLRPVAARILTVLNSKE